MNRCRFTAVAAIATIAVVATVATAPAAERATAGQIVKDPPELQQLLACLQPIRATLGLWEALYGHEPDVSLPTAATITRIEILTTIVAQDRAPAPPPPLAVRDDYATLSRAERREALATISRASVAHTAHAAIARRVAERTSDMVAASNSLITRLNPIAAAPAEPTRFPAAQSVVALEIAACAKVNIGAAELKEFEAVYAFHPEWLRVTNGANARIGKIVPSGIDVCEKPLEELSPCIDNGVVDWDGSCWTRQTGLGFREQRGSGCERDPDGLLSPYFSTRKPPVTKPPISFPKPPPPPPATTLRATVSAFQAALRQLAPAAAAARTHFLGAREKHLAELTPSVRRVAAALDFEGHDLAAEGKRIAAETAALAALAEKVETERAAVDKAASELAGDRKQLAENRARIESLAETLSGLRADIDATRAAIRAADGARAAIRLNCLGEPYATCPDEQAKRSYDEAVFKANETLAGLRALWQEQLARSASLAQERIELQASNLTLLDRIATNTGAVTERRFALQADREELARRSRTLAADVATHAAQREGHDLDVTLLGKAREEIARQLP